MNLIIFKKEDFSNSNTATLSGRRAEHILSVHKAVIGDSLNIGVLNGKMGKGEVVEISKSGKVTFETNLVSYPPKPLPLTLILALPRPKSLKKALHAACSMGVKDIYLINSYRVEKSYWQSPVLSEKKIEELSILALEQACDTTLPKIQFRKRFKPFIEDEIPGIIKDSEAIVAHPYTEKKSPKEIKKHICLAIGPEGGFIDYEIQKFFDAGFTAVSLGERILRVEVAIPAILGKLF